MLTTISKRLLTISEVPAAMREAIPTTKVALSEDGGAGKWVLCHDGKHIISHHGPDKRTGTGNPNYTLVCGTEEEVSAEIKRLGLAVKPTEE